MKKSIFIGVVLALFALNAGSSLAWDSGCNAIDPFSATTGHPCGVHTPCSEGDLFSTATGEPCATNLPAGCISIIGFSPLTGTKCDGTVPVVSPLPSPIPAGNTPVASAPVSKKDLVITYDRVYDTVPYMPNADTGLRAMIPSYHCIDFGVKVLDDNGDVRPGVGDIHITNNIGLDIIGTTYCNAKDGDVITFTQPTLNLSKTITITSN